jgi:hypothetical protein
VALASGPSCGPLKLPCNPATCGGCCASNGACITTPDNNEDTSCGKSGGSCVDCRASGNVCINGSCSGSGGGGGGSGSCGPATCANGCCTGSTVTSVCVDPPTRNNCGGNGALCQSCGTGQTCEGGKCVALGDAGVLGRGCGIDSDCSSLGSAGKCKTKTASARNDYTNGYCTKDCQQTNECGPSGICVEVDPQLGESGSFCWLRCDSQADCRAGYDCYSLGNGQKGCWISPLPEFDAGPPANKVGDMCSDDTQCMNPPDDGFCATSTLPDGGPSPWVGGYCTAPCVDGSHCSTDGGATCVVVTSGAEQAAACLHTCDAPNQGPSSCRTGYLCRGLRQTDGGLAAKGVCLPSCLNVGAVCPLGTTCQTSGYCQ